MTTQTEETTNNDLLTQQQFADYAQRTWIDHQKKIIDELSKLATEFNLEVKFEMKLNLDVIDKSHQRLDQKVYRLMLDYPRTHIR